MKECKSCGTTDPHRYKIYNEDECDRCINISLLREGLTTRAEIKKYSDIYRKYGLNKKEYNSLVKKQAGRCKICGDTPKTFMTDYCHKTGKVRGLLCSSCNTALGCLKENPDNIRKLLRYVNKHKKVAPHVSTWVETKMNTANG